MIYNKNRKKHQNEDELFYVIEVSLIFKIERKDSFIMNEGDIFIIEKGVNHRVSSDEEYNIMLIENKNTEHTEGIKSDITKNIDNQRRS